jgi:hypothetical protein
MSLKTRHGAFCVPLLKLGEQEHLEMLRKGLLYMNSLAYFSALEADVARADPYEGTDSIIQPCDIAEFIFDPHVPGLEPFHTCCAPDGLVGPVRIALNRTSTCNIFCMYAVTRPIVGPIFPQSYKWPGDHFVLFTNPREFLNRAEVAAKSEGLTVQGGVVEYYDESEYSGQTGRFRKRGTFEYQREFRIIAEPGLDGPRSFQIGDLTDITSEVIPLSLADDVLKFTPEDAIAAGLTWD